MGKTKTTQEALQNEIVKMEDLLKKKETAVGNAKVMAALNKQLEQIKKHSYGKKRQRANITRNSGLEKEMPITQKMADFAGWDIAIPKSRVKITRFLCEYIKKNNLQNPDFKREIKLDSGLADLLQYHGRVITYPHIQKYIHNLFEKNDVEDKKEDKKEDVVEDKKEDVVEDKKEDVVEDKKEDVVEDKKEDVVEEKSTSKKVIKKPRKSKQ